jgi:hypothetical protein
MAAGRKQPLRDEVACRAHELYLRRGGEHGKDVEDWLKAERELRDKPAGTGAKERAEQAIRNPVN